MVYLILGVIVAIAIGFCVVDEYIINPDTNCGHKWKRGHNQSYSGIRYCEKCSEIQIFAAKMDWCGNYANLTLDEVREK